VVGSSTHSVLPSWAFQGYRESEVVMTGSSAVFCGVAIERTLGKRSTVGVAEGVP